jgi:tRNA(Ile)-lysidine synthase
MKVLDRVRQFIRDHDLMRAETRVVAAVSGGSDSVALASLLRELDAHGALRLAGIAHFNHQLRATADRDEQLAAAVATALDLAVFVDREDVAARARAERRSIEDAAHAARYAFFERARLHFDADVVALGHTRDDQAETFLLRLVRGAGPRGLAAMHPRNDRIVRPLLTCRRDDLRAWLADRRAEGDRAAVYVDDESNADVAIPRNRVRAELIPLLRARFNPSIVDVLADEADVARETWTWLEDAANEAAGQVVIAPRPDANHVRELDVEALNALPRSLQRIVVWRVMHELARGRPVGFDHVVAALRVAAPDGPSAFDGPGQHVERIRARLVLTGRPLDTAGRWNPANAGPSANLFRYPLSIPGEVPLPQANCIVSARVIPTITDVDREIGVISPRAIVGSGPEAVVRGDLCRGSLAVRNRRPGDRFRPVGLGGQKKLQDFFVDRKIARRDRDAVPLVVDETDRIVWVAGYGIDEAFRVSESAQHVLLLRLTQG